MTHELVPSDVALLDLLRQESQLSIAQLARAMEVTATAVRQRLNRLMAQGFVERSTVKSGRGRPSHRYELTSSGRRRTGENFGDLAIALWQEVREIKDPEVRRGLIERLSKRLAKLYAGQIRGSTLEEKMQSLADIFSQRRIPFEVNQVNALPVLKAKACPYPELAEQDRSICSLERLLFGELLGENVRLDKCRLDGENCCTFEPSSN